MDINKKSQPLWQSSLALFCANFKGNGGKIFKNATEFALNKIHWPDLVADEKIAQISTETDKKEFKREIQSYFLT